MLTCMSYSSATLRQFLIAAGVVPQSSWSFNPTAPARIISGSPSTSDVFPCSEKQVYERNWLLCMSSLNPQPNPKPCVPHGLTWRSRTLTSIVWKFWSSKMHAWVAQIKKKSDLKSPKHFSHTHTYLASKTDVERKLVCGLQHETHVLWRWGARCSTSAMGWPSPAPYKRRNAWQQIAKICVIWP